MIIYIYDAYSYGTIWDDLTAGDLYGTPSMVVSIWFA